MVKPDIFRVKDKTGLTTIIWRRTIHCFRSHTRGSPKGWGLTWVSHAHGSGLIPVHRWGIVIAIGIGSCHAALASSSYRIKGSFRVSLLQLATQSLDLILLLIELGVGTVQV